MLAFQAEAQIVIYYGHLLKDIYMLSTSQAMNKFMRGYVVQDTGVAKDFLKRTAVSQEIRPTVGKWDIMKR